MFRYTQDHDMLPTDKVCYIAEEVAAVAAVQCGFCMSGMIMRAKALLDRNRKPPKKEVIKTMPSNVCRCTGYKKIVAAVEAAAPQKASMG